MRPRAGYAKLLSGFSLATAYQTWEVRAELSRVRRAVVHGVGFVIYHLSLASVATVGVPVDRNTTGVSVP